MSQTNMEVSYTKITYDQRHNLYYVSDMIYMYIIKHIINFVAFCMYFFLLIFTVIQITIMLISAADSLKMKIHFRPTVC